MPSELINETAAAKILGLSVASLRTYRSTKRVIIPYVKISKRVLYDPEILQKFIHDHMVGGEE